MEKKLTIAQLRSSNRKAHPEVVREFNRIYGRYTPDYEEKLYEYLQEPATIKLWGEVFKKEIDDAIEELIKKQMERKDFVDFSDADLRKKIRMLLTRIRKESPSIEARIRIQLGVLERLNNLDSFYDYDKLENIVESIVKDFTKIFQEGDEPTRRLLFDKVKNYINLFVILNGLVTPLEKFLVESYIDLDEYTEDIKNYFNTRIDIVSSSEDMSNDSKDYYIGIYAESMLNVMTRKGATQEELLNYARNYWALMWIRQWFINYYRRNEQLVKAIDLLEESIFLDKEIPELVENYKSYQAELKALYNKGLAK